MIDDADVTALLLAWSDGEEAARSRLMDTVYEELRQGTSEASATITRWHLRCLRVK